MSATAQFFTEAEAAEDIDLDSPEGCRSSRRPGHLEPETVSRRCQRKCRLPFTPTAG